MGIEVVIPELKVVFHGAQADGLPTFHLRAIRFSSDTDECLPVRLPGLNPAQADQAMKAGTSRAPGGHSHGRKPIAIFLDTISLAIGALLPIMNPFSTAPLFVSLTADMDSRRRNHQALMGCVYAFAILVVFLLLGSAIIEFFGISIAGIRVAGGLIISYVGFRMLFPPSQPATPVEGTLQASDRDIAFTPIAMPSLAGPGSISVVLSAAAQIRSVRPQDWHLIYVAVIIGMALTLILSYLVLRTASSMVRFLGQGGIDAMTRIFGFLLVCIGMQFLLTGLGDFFSIPHA
jgi:multiple antibiotic resistance protein